MPSASQQAGRFTDALAFVVASPTGSAASRSATGTASDARIAAVWMPTATIATPAKAAAEAEASDPGLFGKLGQGLARSTAKFAEGLAALGRRRLDAAALEGLEDLLITSDMGAAVAARVTRGLAKGRFDREISDEEIRSVLAHAGDGDRGRHALELLAERRRKVAAELRRLDSVMEALEMATDESRLAAQ